MTADVLVTQGARALGSHGINLIVLEYSSRRSRRVNSWGRNWKSLQTLFLKWFSLSQIFDISFYLYNDFFIWVEMCSVLLTLTISVAGGSYVAKVTLWAAVQFESRRGQIVVFRHLENHRRRRNFGWNVYKECDPVVCKAQLPACPGEKLFSMS